VVAAVAGPVTNGTIPAAATAAIQRAA